MAKTDYEAVTGRARASVGDAAEHLSEAAGSAARGVRQLKEDTGRYAKEQLYRAADQAMEKGREAYDLAETSISQQSSQLDVYVRNNPMKSIGIAFGIGMLFGAMTRR